MDGVTEAGVMFSHLHEKEHILIKVCYARPSHLWNVHQ